MRESIRALRVSLPDAWEAVGRNELRKRNINLERYARKTIKERILDGLSVPFIEDLYDFAEMEGVPDSELAGRLAVNRATWNRQANEETRPKPSTFFSLLILGLNKNVHDLIAAEACPKSAPALGRTLRLTLSVIRQKECGAGFEAISQEDFDFIQEFIWYPGSEVFVTDPHRAARTGEGGKIIADVANLVRGRHPQGRLSSASGKDLKALIERWAKPYTLFWIGAECIMESIYDITD